MKKITLPFVLFIIFVQTANTQIKWKDYSQSYQSDSGNVPSLYIAVPKDNDSFWATNNNSSLKESLLKDSLFLINHSKNIIAVTTFDTANAHFFLKGVNKKNANEYEFRVIDNQNKSVFPWTNITRFTTDTVQTESGLSQMAYLGGYKNTFRNQIIIDVRKRGNDKILTTGVVRWVSIGPVLLNIYTANELNEFLKRLSEYGIMRLSTEEINKWKEQYPANQLDEVTSLPLKLKVGYADNNLIFYLRAEIYNKEQVEYELTKAHTILRPWNINEFDNCFIWIKNLSPGEYLLRIRYSVQRENVTDYPFLIETAWYQSAAFKIISAILAVAFFGFVIFLILLIKQKQKTTEELGKKVKLQLELKAIHAQLNPHFVFNALNSIQGLINKQDIRGANMYLADFASLMRDSLTKSEDLTTLKEELITLETYLKLEQLRFGFKYYINVNDINIYETEIPSLLLQPLIENAIKHGTSSLKENGIVSLEFLKCNNDMIVAVKDNGGGFLYNEDSAGYGLKLTRDRIKLLNQILHEQSIELDIRDNSPSGTIAGFTFKNWLL
jgi:two-component system, LytTR family, sensor kinase